MVKKVVLLAGLAVLAALQAAVAWNDGLCSRAKAAAGPEAKTRLLVRANAVFPWNAAVHFELGRAYFESGAEALGEPEARDRFFGLAVESFQRSLRLDPASPETHFHLAQTLLDMSYVPLPAPLGHFDEYLKAAALTGHNSQIYFEVGRVLLDRWPSLTVAEKGFTEDILRKMLAGRNEDRLLSLLGIWALEGRDEGLLERILPDDAPMLRACARYLGERSLAPLARQSALARAEKLDFTRAQRQLARGRQQDEAFRPAEAKVHYEDAAWVLRSIKFYQDLAGRELIDPREFRRVLTEARRFQAMNGIVRTRSIADEDGVIAAYLALEDDAAALGEFEDFVKSRRLLGEAPAGTASFADLPALALRLALGSRRRDYEEVARIGALAVPGSSAVPTAYRTRYVRVLGLVGEACLERQDLPAAERSFRQALELEPENLDILLGLERCYDPSDLAPAAADVRRTIDRLVSPAAIDLAGRAVGKGETFTVELVTDGRPRTLRLGFEAEVLGSAPLVSIVMNGRVVWEKNGDTGLAEFAVSPRAGRNALEITAVGGAIRLGGLGQVIPAGGRGLFIGK